MAKKIFFFVLATVVGISSIFGQSFTQVKTTMKYKKAFYVCTADTLFEVSACKYSVVSKSPRDFYIAEFNSTKDGFRVVVHKNEFLSELTTIDSLGISNDQVVEVYLANDSVYRTKNEKWLKASVGQSVVHTKILCSQRSFERYRTITEDERASFKENIPDKVAPYAFPGVSPMATKASTDKKQSVVTPVNANRSSRKGKEKSVTYEVSKQVNLIES